MRHVLAVLAVALALGGCAGPRAGVRPSSGVREERAAVLTGYGGLCPAGFAFIDVRYAGLDVMESAVTAALAGLAASYACGPKDPGCPAAAMALAVLIGQSRTVAYACSPPPSGG